MSRMHGNHDRHAGHSVAMFRDKFWLSLALTVPVVFWSTDVQHWLGYTAPSFPGSKFIPAILGTAVSVYGGLVFIRGAWGELADHKLGMMTLISLAIVVAFGMSLASEIINRLRSLYKKSSPKRELVAINEVIGEMVRLLRGEANEYAVSIRTDLAADLPKITADRVQLQQVLMNLMLNGIEAMKETGGVLTVKTGRGECGQVLISVSDTGVGLPARGADEIFNAFFTTKPQGSGMGLAISRSIVESHGGRLWATSHDGRGATLHFTLPTTVVEVSAAI